MFLKLVLSGFLLLKLSGYFPVAAQFLIPDVKLTDSLVLSEIVDELNVPTIAVLLLQRRFKPIFGDFLSRINQNLQQSITFDDRQKFLLWVEESQKLGYGTTTLVFGTPKDLIEEVGICDRMPDISITQ